MNPTLGTLQQPQRRASDIVDASLSTKPGSLSLIVCCYLETMLPDQQTITFPFSGTKPSHTVLTMITLFRYMLGANSCRER